MKKQQTPEEATMARVPPPPPGSEWWEDRVDPIDEEAEDVLRPVSGVGPCPHCKEIRRYDYHAEEPCDDCIDRWTNPQNDKSTCEGKTND